jgi:hypothetical protein
MYRYVMGSDHFYTTNTSEIGVTATGQTGKYGFICEGILGYVSETPDTYLIPIYRYAASSHFYTTSATELGTEPGPAANSGYTYEGIAGYVPALEEFNTVPVYRFYNKAIGAHLYTNKLGELGPQGSAPTCTIPGWMIDWEYENVEFNVYADLQMIWTAADAKGKYDSCISWITSTNEGPYGHHSPLTKLESNFVRY